jgi:hypothetical protein
VQFHFSIAVTHILSYIYISHSRSVAAAVPSPAKKKKRKKAIHQAAGGKQDG